MAILCGKSFASVSFTSAVLSGENDIKNGFDMPFVESANYLGMQYLGNVHSWFDGDEIHADAIKIIDTFKEKLHSN